ncbi:exported hypothetical protein [Thiocapsa sp. KS1]|nr:DUF692 family multinuclear iron-containing protein [Thiocapsa sp. KS1]CRI65723.1 exported hypothetical protein [Thiocapsa sp. KS1]
MNKKTMTPATALVGAALVGSLGAFGLAHAADNPFAAKAFVCHGLSLSIGAPTPLDLHFVVQIKTFLDDHGIRAYTEHLSYCSDDGHLYDLLPIPFTEEAVRHVAERVRQVQEILERRIALENVSYYGASGQEMSEIEFSTFYRPHGRAILGILPFFRSWRTMNGSSWPCRSATPSRIVPASIRPETCSRAVRWSRRWPGISAIASRSIASRRGSSSAVVS